MGVCQPGWKGQNFAGKFLLLLEIVKTFVQEARGDAKT